VEHGSFVAFDAAHGYGSIRDDRKVGTLGDFEVFSFSGTKPVTSGEGGLVSTPHEWLADRVRYLRAYGFQQDYRSRFIGLNGKLSELHAALGVLELAQAETLMRHRQELVAHYRDRLGDSVTWQLVRPNDRSTYKDLAVELGASRSRVEHALTNTGVQTKRYFVPLHTMDVYARYSHTPQPVTDAVHNSTLCIPLFADLTISEIDMICDTILSALRD
jgi:dTDP-4-amino-4,6-dideoxygalactose transaminase